MKLFHAVHVGCEKSNGSRLERNEARSTNELVKANEWKGKRRRNAFGKAKAEYEWTTLNQSQPSKKRGKMRKKVKSDERSARKRSDGSVAKRTEFLVLNLLDSFVLNEAKLDRNGIF